MGHRTILHGYILGLDDLEYARLNREGLAVLPEWSPETYPLVTREMFAKPHYGYLGPSLCSVSRTCVSQAGSHV